MSGDLRDKGTKEKERDKCHLETCHGSKTIILLLYQIFYLLGFAFGKLYKILEDLMKSSMALGSQAGSSGKGATSPCLPYPTPAVTSSLSPSVPSPRAAGG
jgi:hypothetical protein